MKGPFDAELDRLPPAVAPRGFVRRFEGGNSKMRVDGDRQELGNYGTSIERRSVTGLKCLERTLEFAYLALECRKRHGGRVDALDLGQGVCRAGLKRLDLVTHLPEGHVPNCGGGERARERSLHGRSSSLTGANSPATWKRRTDEPSTPSVDIEPISGGRTKEKF